MWDGAVVNTVDRCHGVFMATAIVVVALSRHVIGAYPMQMVAATMCGLIFGWGLLISEMTQPAKVIGFLDVFGTSGPKPGRGHGGGTRGIEYRI